MDKLKVKDYVKKWQHTPYGRANHLLNSYRQSDKKANRGECNLTTVWILENIFTKPCSHCGKEGWDVIGCNRLDNSKPHTMDNVEPCCFDCNRKYKKSKQKYKKSKYKKLYADKLYQYTTKGELINIFEGYIWSKTPLKFE